VFGTNLKTRRARTAVLGVAALIGATGLAGCSGGSGTPVLTWYINPDNGTQAKLATECTKAANGRYTIQTALLPRESTGQREQLVRRLAAKDSGIDLMSLDLPYLAEFANAGFVRQFTADEQQELTDGMLSGPLESAKWDGKLFAVPFNTNTQLLWYHKSVAQKAGLTVDANTQLTWQQVIDAAAQTGTTVQVQAKKYEGYTVLINSLIASAGGEILKNPEAGRDVTPSINSAAGKAAAGVIGSLADSKAAPADLSNSDEGTTQAGFLAKSGGFMTNWPFVYTAETTTLNDLKKQLGEATSEADKAKLQEQVDAQQARVDDFGFARWPSVGDNQESAPPLGGINVAIGAYTEDPEFAVDAVKCITSEKSQQEYMLGEGLLSTWPDVYNQQAIKDAFPMAGLLRDSVDGAAPRPITPYYSDVTAAIQNTWHPPNAVNEQTPERSAKLIVDVLHDRQLI
jgi:multiple sugar transport system substrate-binding protein